ncbi:MAG: type II toxin-antitoxin system VapC family toxin [Spirochaetales bacterium]|nr:type II toxin-antitoxin system VapC family toxin [Spirochaetales bacterium]
MKYLLDTHSLIWAFGDDENLSPIVHEILKTKNEIYISIVSLWEIEIKKSIGKLNVPYSMTELAEQCIKEQVNILPLTPQIIDMIEKLPTIHKDPFDRIIICNALADDMTIITRDEKIIQYDVKTLW